MEAKFFIGIVIITLLSFVSKAQDKIYPELHEVFVCKNVNGLIETLKIGRRTVYYKSSANPNKEIELKIYSSNITDMQDKPIVGENFIVRFPNSTQNYKLETCIACPEIICTNPNGTKQIFKLQYDVWGQYGLFRCKNKNGTREYIIVKNITGEIKVTYYSSVNKTKIPLRVYDVDIADMGTLKNCKVGFPSSSQSYDISYEQLMLSTANYYRAKPIILCKNPNGTIQYFEWISK